MAIARKLHFVESKMPYGVQLAQLLILLKIAHFITWGKMDTINALIILLIFYGHIKIFFLDVAVQELDKQTKPERVDTESMQSIPLYHYGVFVKYLELK